MVGAGAVVGAAGAGAEVPEAIPGPLTPAAEALAAVVEAEANVTLFGKPHCR